MQQTPWVVISSKGHYCNDEDVVDDYVRISECTLIENLRKFVRAVVEVFGEEYLRSPNTNDISRLLAQVECRGFLGMVGGSDSQESVRKDVERAFGVLQALFAIVREPSCFWDLSTLRDIMKAHIIMHTMIVEE
ncbi:hypothetical protein HHK36_007375 [Tetracentron sinense]|uniref:Uncharacterized protein n=1 Tax=Tetracentron sinense TaxID=13715 RepID=A0A834ZIT1_TETSI|nr:hypothetical protein HHK36_007375 [Tetracentron sinense]